MAFFAVSLALPCALKREIETKNRAVLEEPGTQRLSGKAKCEVKIEKL
jgi:hypothetical protein